MASIVTMAQRADATIKSLPDDEHRLVARRILLRLVQFGEGRLHTRRQQTVAQLSSVHANKPVFETTLQHLTEERLLTIADARAGQGAPPAESENGDEYNELKDKHSAVDIAHDKLINGWSSLREWIHERRNDEEIRRTLESKTNEWIQLGRKRFGGGLLDKIELAECDKWIESVEAAALGEIPELEQLQKVSRTWIRLQQALIAAVPVLVVVAMGFWVWGLREIAKKERERAGEENRRAEAEKIARKDAEKLLVAEQRFAIKERHARIAEAKRADEAEKRADMNARVVYNARLKDAAELYESDLSAASDLLQTMDKKYRGFAWKWYGGRTKRSLFSTIHDGAGCCAQDDNLLVVARKSMLKPTSTEFSFHYLSGKGETSSSSARQDCIEIEASGIRLLETSRNGHVIAAANNQHLFRITVRDGGVEKIDADVESITSIALSSAGDLLVSGAKDGTIVLHDVPGGSRLITKKTDSPIRYVTFMPRKRRVLSCHDDSSVRCWQYISENQKKLEQVWILETENRFLRSVSVTDDQLIMATAGSFGEVRLWRISGNDRPPSLHRTIKTTLHQVTAVAFSRDGTMLAGGSNNTIDNPMAVGVWNVESGKEVFMFKPVGIEIARLCFSTDGKALFAIGDEFADILSITNHNVKARYNPDDPSLAILGPVTGLAAAPNEHTFVASLSTNRILAIRPRSSEQSVYKKVPSIVHSPRFSPNGEIVALAGWDGKIYLLDAESFEVRNTVNAHEGAVYDIAFSPDGQTVASCGADRKINLWHFTLNRTAVFKKFEGDACAMKIAYSAGGLNLAAAWNEKHFATERDSFNLYGRGHVSVWKAEACILVADREFGMSNSVLEFLPGSDSEVLIGKGRYLVKWDTSSDNIAEATGHRSPITDIAISHDQMTLATSAGIHPQTTAREPGEIIIWDPSLLVPRLKFQYEGRGGSYPLAVAFDSGILLSAEVLEDGSKWVQVWDSHYSE